MLHPKLVAREDLKVTWACGGWCLHTERFTTPASAKLDLCKLWGQKVMGREVAVTALSAPTGSATSSLPLLGL